MDRRESVFIERVGRLTLPFPVEADIAGDLEEPAPEGCLSLAKCGERPQSADHRVLHCVLGVLPLTQDPETEDKERPFVQSQERVQSGEVTRLGRLQQGSLPYCPLIAL